MPFKHIARKKQNSLFDSYYTYTHICEGCSPCTLPISVAGGRVVRDGEETEQHLTDTNKNTITCA